MRAILSLLVVLALPVVASAHVIVVPEQSEAGGWERYTMLVPTEKSSPTSAKSTFVPRALD
jgi:uncharacterized protein YcnI